MVAFRLVSRNLFANRIRLALTTAAIVLGIAFVTASFVLADGIRGSFRDVGVSIASGTDFEVRPVEHIGERSAFSEDILRALTMIPSVAAVGGQVETEGIQPVKADGQLLVTIGPPQIGYAWIDDDALNPFTVTGGRAPAHGAEFVMDSISIADNDFVIGRTYDLITPTGRRSATLVGATRFGPGNTTLGATLVHLPLETAQEWFGVPGRLKTVSLRLGPDADRDETTAAIAKVLTPDLELVDQRTLIDETTAKYTTITDLIGNTLLGFAAISLFVSSLIIANTFSVVVSHRSRELAVLRSLGASRRQARNLVLSEAVVIGTGASVIGIAAGIGVALGLRALFGVLGLDLPDADLIVRPRTWIVAMLAGVGVTVIASLRPAARAARMAPVAAMRGNAAGAEAPVTSTTRRTGAVLAVAALVAVVAGLSAGGDTRYLTVAVGALLAMAAALVLSPRGVRPFVSLIGRPVLSAFGTDGKLARTNALRNPRRTASTAGALTIGLSVITAVVISGASIKRHIGKEIDTSITADLVLQSRPDPAIGLSPDVADAVARDPRFATVSAVRSGTVRIAGKSISITGLNRSTISATTALTVVKGALNTGVNDLALERSVASQLGLGVGDEVEMELASGPERAMTVTAIYDREGVVREGVVGLDWWRQVDPTPTDSMILAQFARNQDRQQRMSIIASLAQVVPQATIETRAEYRDRVVGQIDQILMIVNLMVVLTIITALLGIANTLALAIFERTRELGLLRAVGMSRRHVRRTIRCEAVLIAVFGAVQGVAMGLVLGLVTVAVLPGTLVDGSVVPIGTITAIAAISVVAGILAAVRPAGRASRLDILEAIAIA